MQEIIQCKEVTIRYVAKVIGILVSTFSAVEYGKLHYRNLENAKTRALKKNKADFDAEMVVTTSMRVELRWWYVNIRNQVRHISHGNPELTIQTDASLQGWGFVLNACKSGGRWTKNESQKHINVLELLAIYYTIKAVADKILGKHIKILLDSSTAVCYINNMGGSTENEADVFSRRFNDQLEWELNTDVFRNICEKTRVPNIDLFASRLNAKFAGTLYSEDNYRHGKLHSNCSTVANPAVVHTTDEIVSTETVDSTVTKGSIGTPARKQGSSSVEENDSNCMSCVRKIFRQRGFSKEAARIFMCSWKSGTKRQYQMYISRWLQYCRGEKISEISITVVNVIEFLTILFTNGLGYSAINTARGALSAFGLVVDGYHVGSHPDVTRFMKGIFNLRPTKPKYVNTWDVNLVLNYLRKLSPVKHLSLKELTLKLVMLIAITNAARAQTVHLLSINNMNKSSSQFVFKFDSLLKQSRPGADFSVFVLKAYPPDRRLCVYTVLKEYLKRTKVIRDQHKKLLISYIKPYAPVTRDTVSRWIKTVMFRSGVNTDVFTPHSVRGASLSKAKFNAVPVQAILHKAGWSNCKTFSEFYDREVAPGISFEEGVLK
ncbi:uncharacterized protein LOC123525594 [Mercenaria mercenaria]|uniref:uncharacterized protein LOC123525594 n=1 Tax=Mercenaria mercenaria TaxID=6596 RepID=UPI00234E59ED|nr:uncharacterized protein LOC123525594 [Mercenaria mercenaria]